MVVSDFRGRRDWRAPMPELAGRNTVVAVEIRDPREQELPNVGELHLVDPESGRQLRVDTQQTEVAGAVCGGRDGGTGRSGGRDDANGRAACCSLDMGRLAADLPAF